LQIGSGQAPEPPAVRRPNGLFSVNLTSGSQMKIVPDYIEGKVLPTNKSDPASLLIDGHWCGHGEPIFHIFDVRVNNDEAYSFQLPESNENVSHPSVVMVMAESGYTFPIYDSRKHPASIYHPDNSISSKEHRLQPPYHCPECGKLKFKLAVGFEVPSDSVSENDTSWFALAAKCLGCNWHGIAYEDETA